MAENVVQRQELVDAGIDSRDIGTFANGPAIVFESREGGPRKTMLKIQQDAEGQVTEAIARKFYDTVVEMDADLGNQPLKMRMQVDKDTAANNGVYIRTASGREKSTLQPATSASLAKVEDLPAVATSQPNLFSYSEVDFSNTSRMIQGSAANVIRTLIDGVAHCTFIAPTGSATVGRWQFLASEIKEKVFSAGVTIAAFEASVPPGRTTRFLIDQYDPANAYIPAARRQIVFPGSVSQATLFVIEDIALDPAAVSVLYQIENLAGSGAPRTLTFRNPMIAAGKSGLYRAPAGLTPAQGVSAKALADSASAAAVAPYQSLPGQVETAIVLANEALVKVENVPTPTFDPSNLPAPAALPNKTAIYEELTAARLIFSNREVWRDALGLALTALESQSAKAIRLAGGSDSLFLIPSPLGYSVDHFYGNGTGANYPLRANGDGLIQSKGGRVAPIGEATSATGLPASELQGAMTVSASNPNAYLTGIGSGFKVLPGFNGTGISIPYFGNPQGAVIRWIIDEGTTNEQRRDVSTWDASAGDRTQVLSGFADGFHTLRAVFLGADPLHPPASGGPRGWFKYLTTSNVPVMYETSKGVAPSNVWPLSNASVLEFAINASPVGSGLSGAWVPLHSGLLGSTRNIVVKYVLDGKVVAALPTVRTRFKTLRIEQTFGGYNANDGTPGTKMFDGRQVIEFSDNGIRFEVSGVGAPGVESASNAAYVCHAAASSAAVNKLKLSDGSVRDIGSADKSTTLPFVPTGIMYYHTSGSAALGASVRSNVETADPTLAGTNDPGALYTERSDSVTKVYWRFLTGGARIKPGQVFGGQIQLAAVSGVDPTQI